MTTKLIIIGGPGTGKTCLANYFSEVSGIEVKHTDDLIVAYQWSEVSDVIANSWMERDGPWIIEGVAAVRGLRKWLTNHQEENDLSGITIFLANQVFVPRTKKTMAMAKGITTIWLGIVSHLKARKIKILTTNEELNVLFNTKLSLEGDALCTH